jgi:hypothetical protein
MGARPAVAAAVVSALCALCALTARSEETTPAEAAALRDDALARASLWREPRVPVEQADLLHNPSGPASLSSSGPVECRFLPKATNGRTSKFYCRFEGGEVLKVKYGRNPEIYTEVAATRLLEALGAGADRMYFVRQLRCFGCPRDPQALLSCISSRSEARLRACRPLYGEVTTTGAYAVRVDYSAWVDFGPVSVEHALEGEEIRGRSGEGWGWDELDRLQARARRSPAERDALRLVAVLLANWDNKADNQRLVCLAGGLPKEGARCSRPFAYMADVGATFGRADAGGESRRKLDLEAWRTSPVWEDRETCRVRIVSPHLHGATFGTAAISESGRRLLASRLGRLTARQMHDLFEGAGFADYEGANAAGRDLDGWVKALRDKVHQITERLPCPAA